MRRFAATLALVLTSAMLLTPSAQAVETLDSANTSTDSSLQTSGTARSNDTAQRNDAAQSNNASDSNETANTQSSNNSNNSSENSTQQPSATASKTTASGTWGCPWHIENGVLHIGTQDGQTLNQANTGGQVSPWASYANDITAISIDYRINAPQNMSYMFYGLTHVRSITAPRGWDWSNVESAENVCNNDLALTQISAFKDLDTSRLRSIKYAFKYCEQLTDVSALGGWNTAGIWGMDGVFSNCAKLADVSALANWNVSSATSMTEMFRSCSSLTDISPLGGWNVANVTGMTDMFHDCSNLADISVLGGWNVGKVENFAYMFSYCTKLTTLSNANTKRGIGSWQMSRAYNICNMFEHCLKLSDISALGSWDTSRVEWMNTVFEGDASLHDISALGSWNVRNVVSMTQLFNGINTTDSTSMDFSALANWRLDRLGSNVSNYTRIFTGIPNITKIGVPPASSGTQQLMKAYLEAAAPADQNPSDWASSHTEEMEQWQQKTMWLNANGVHGTYTGPFSLSTLSTLMTQQPSQFANQEVYVRQNPTGMLGVKIFLWYKNVNSDDVPHGGKAEFTEHIHLVDKLGKPVTGTFSGEVISNTTGKTDGTKNSFTVTFDAQGNATITAYGWHTTVIDGLPADATYTVTQEMPEGYSSLGSENMEGTIPEGAAAVATVMNEYYANPVTVHVSLTKNMAGYTQVRPLKAGQYQFNLGEVQANGSCLQKTSEKNKADGSVSLSWTYKVPGTYKLLVWEASGKDHLIKYDSHKVTVTVTITDDGSGQLAISSYQVSGSTTFTNYVYRPATLPKTGLPTYWGLITAVIVALMFALAAAVWSVRGGRKGAR